MTSREAAEKIANWLRKVSDEYLELSVKARERGKTEFAEQEEWKSEALGISAIVLEHDIQDGEFD